MATWHRGLEVEPRELLGSPQVGELELELPDMVVVWNGSSGRQAAFGEQAVPLSDRRGWLVGEIQAAYDLAALPAAIGCLRGAAQQRGVMRRMADPQAVEDDRSDLHALSSGDAGVLELANEPRDPAIFAAGEDLDGLLVLECLDRSG